MSSRNAESEYGAKVQRRPSIVRRSVEIPIFALEKSGVWIIAISGKRFLEVMQDRDVAGRVHSENGSTTSEPRVWIIGTDVEVI